MPTTAAARAGLPLTIAALLLAPAGAGAAGDDVTLRPATGTIHTTFVAQFTTPEGTTGHVSNPGKFFTYEGRGPRGCGTFFLSVSGGPAHAVGDGVTIPIKPASIGERVHHKTWCPGHYRGKVQYVETDDSGDVLAQELIGHFAFKVNRP
jgi:hypothetical protein